MNSQHSFVKERSWLTNLIEFFEEITKYVGETSAVGVNNVDFSVTFDNAHTETSPKGP